MGAQPATVTRRYVLALALGGAGNLYAAALAGNAPTQKITQSEAQYQTQPKDIRSCGSCSLFQPPNACKVVEGIIARSGWCKLYVAVD